MELLNHGISDPHSPSQPRIRPTPEQVCQAVLRLQHLGGVVLIPRLVDALRSETGCSRATAYRAVSDAFELGRLMRE